MLSHALHYYSHWARQRIGEMDAAIVTLQRHIERSHAGRESRQLVADLKKRRNRFKALVSKQAKRNEAAWDQAKTRMESEWEDFEAVLTAYLKKAKRQSGFQKSTFRKVADAQSEAWREVDRSLRALARKAMPARRSALTTVIKRIRNNGAVVRKRTTKLSRSAMISWSVMHSALNATRKAFDRANHQATKAVQRAFR